MSVKAKVDAIDRFVRTLKSGGLYDDINAACVMAGWTNLAGALYPLKGSAPTNNGFLAADLDAGIGLQGDASSYLNSNRNSNADPQDDYHAAVWVSKADSGSSGAMYLGSGGPGITGSTNIGSTTDLASPDTIFRSRSATSDIIASSASSTGLIALSRSVGGSYGYRSGSLFGSKTRASETPANANYFVFSRNLSGTPSLPTDATLSWYSIGSSTDLAALDSAVSTLMADLRAIDEDGFEPESVNYLRAVEAADGAYLETGVKQAINSFIVGLKKDNLWNALKASCILCGARTIAGALVPLAGTAPTAYGGWSSGDYNRETGLKGNGTTKYLNSNHLASSQYTNDTHFAVWHSEVSTTGLPSGYGVSIGCASKVIATGLNSFSMIRLNQSLDQWVFYVNSANALSGTGGSPNSTGFMGASRSDATNVTYRRNGASGVGAIASQDHAENAPYGVFQTLFTNFAGQTFPTDARIAFYSIGSAIADLALLDARVSTLVSQIAAAIP